MGRRSPCLLSLSERSLVLPTFSPMISYITISLVQGVACAFSFSFQKLFGIGFVIIVSLVVSRDWLLGLMKEQFAMLALVFERFSISSDGLRREPRFVPSRSNGDKLGSQRLAHLSVTLKFRATDATLSGLLKSRS